MDIGRGLPRFGVTGFMESVAKGAEKRNKIEEAERRERERLDEEKRRKAEARREMWTTPDRRPLAEPPILHWEHFVRKWIPSDLRYKALFPNDPGKRAAAKDIKGEHAALIEYLIVLRNMRDDLAEDDARRQFYTILYDDVDEDVTELLEDHDSVFSTATQLGLFEFQMLDNDGKTTQLEERIKKGADIFLDWPEEVKMKYRHLVPLNFVENPVATFEFRWFGMKGSHARIRDEINERGHGFLVGWPQEVQDKYGWIKRWPSLTHRRNTRRKLGQINYSNRGKTKQTPTHQRKQTTNSQVAPPGSPELWWNKSLADEYFNADGTFPLGIPATRCSTIQDKKGQNQECFHLLPQICLHRTIWFTTSLSKQLTTRLLHQILPSQRRSYI